VETAYHTHFLRAQKEWVESEYTDSRAIASVDLALRHLKLSQGYQET